MSRKLWCAAVALGLVLAACASKQPAVQTIRTQFLPQRVDALDDVGRGDSLALDKAGNPHMSYIGLLPVLEEGEIPPARAASAPALPAVLVSSQDKGQFQHGFVVQTDISGTKQTPLPLTTASQTAMAVAEDGTEHVVWAQFHGLLYASAPPVSNEPPTFGEPQTVADVFAASPSIALDADGNPVVAFVQQADSGGGASLKVATLGGGKKPTWSVRQVADLGTCLQDCPLFSAVIRSGPEGQVIAFADVQGDVSVATESAGTWSQRRVAQRVGATGLSLAIGTDGTEHLAYATSDGKVQYATSSGSGATFRVSTVATYRPPPPPTASPTTSPTPSASASPSPSPSASASGGSPSPSPTPKEKAAIVPGTSVGVDGKGNVYVAWADPETRELGLASTTGGGSFERIPTAQTDAGEFPSMVVTPGGHVQVAWYNADAQDLMLGSYPETLGAFAVPVPSTPSTQGGGATGPALKCPKGTVEIIAPVGAGGSGFQTTSVTAPGGDFQLCFNNEDNTATHNVEVFKSASDAAAGATPLAGDQPFTGPKLDVFPVSGLAAGDYYFHCVVHPSIMTGTLTVK